METANVRYTLHPRPNKYQLKIAAISVHSFMPLTLYTVLRDLPSLVIAKEDISLMRGIREGPWGGQIGSTSGAN